MSDLLEPHGPKVCLSSHQLRDAVYAYVLEKKLVSSGTPFCAEFTICDIDNNRPVVTVTYGYNQPRKPQK